MTLNSSVNLYNNTVIPIAIPPDAQSNATDVALVQIAGEPDQVVSPTDPAADTHYGVNAAGDITISADQGEVSTTATGIGTNIYLEALAEAASAISNLFGGGSISFNITAARPRRTARAYWRSTASSIRASRRTRRSPSAMRVRARSPLRYVLLRRRRAKIPVTISGPYPVGEAILTRLAELQSLLAQYGQDPIAVGAYQSEITFLERRTCWPWARDI